MFLSAMGGLVLIPLDTSSEAISSPLHPLVFQPVCETIYNSVRDTCTLDDSCSKHGIGEIPTVV